MLFIVRIIRPSTTQTDMIGKVQIKDQIAHSLEFNLALKYFNYSFALDYAIHYNRQVHPLPYYSPHPDQNAI